LPRAYALSFKPSAAPIREPVTKFGGQPTWIQPPQWPISLRTGEQMTFICQIVIYPEVFGQCVGKMAYLFISEQGSQALPTWDADAGENAVIVQPGHPPKVPVKPLANGPSLYEFAETLETALPQANPCEYAVDLIRQSDPDFLNESQRLIMDEPNFALYSKAVEGNKIGGTPSFLQEDALPPSGHLLLQLDSAQVPFSLNFGDCGVGYAFISPDGSMGKFLFQSY
jgi:hypothetical protein